MGMTPVRRIVVFLILVTPEIMDAIALATWFPRLGTRCSSSAAAR